MSKIKNLNLLPKTVIFKKSILAVFILFILTSCGETKINTKKKRKTVYSSLNLNPDERKKIITNTLFESVIDDKPNEEIDKILSFSEISIHSTNKKGDTALGTAIKFKRKSKLLNLIKKFQCQDFYHKNNIGESYVFLAAKYGYEEIIHYMGDKCYRDNIFNFIDYSFSDLDPETDGGQNAFHVALNGSIMEALDYEYKRGVFENNWFNFYSTDEKEESFLHTAVKDDRINTVNWAIRKYCDPSDFEKSKNSWLSIPTYTITHGWNIFQFYFHKFSKNFDQIINYQNLDGNTALHLAARSLNTKMIRLISRCRWTDLLMENNEGDIPLQVFLKNLNPFSRNYDLETKSTFVFLVNKEPYLQKQITHIEETVNYPNKTGDTASHISAQLADPYFYNYISKFADIYLENNYGDIPEEIFNSTQNNIKWID